jgi:LuxR family maltose regulon positive regulatory protein
MLSAWLHWHGSTSDWVTAHAPATLDESAREVVVVPIVPLFNPVPAERARLLLALGDVDAVDRWVSERHLSEVDCPLYSQERDYMIRARLLLARGTPDRAIALLDRIHAGAAAAERFGNLIEICVLQALARDAMEHPDRARDDLLEARVLAEPEGYVRVFADEGASMAALLNRLLENRQVLATARVKTAYVRQLSPPACPFKCDSAGREHYQ